MNLQQAPLIDDRRLPAGVRPGKQLAQDEFLAPHLHVVAHPVDGIPAVPDFVPEPRVLLPEPVYLLLVQAFALTGHCALVGGGGGVCRAGDQWHGGATVGVGGVVHAVEDLR
ncbi:hypothetical protein [Salinispora pacifica]|uniref:hypothetical protein n=1 Tax=Salinispora pacifica TaxID=351187 RepID=UPI0018DEDE5C|nr:hypothetical protein [Salinispora pacifica]